MQQLAAQLVLVILRSSQDDHRNVLGGLVTTTLFSLVVVPGIYLLFGAEREAELELHAASQGSETGTLVTPAEAGQGNAELPVHLEQVVGGQDAAV